MDGTLAWLATLATVAVLVAYEAVLATAQRRRPDRLARSAHALLREEWFTAVSQHKGSEILAVQTLPPWPHPRCTPASDPRRADFGVAAPPLAGPVAAVLVVVVMPGFDRIGAR